MRKIIAIPLGDVAGIGPEICGEEFERSGNLRHM